MVNIARIFEILGDFTSEHKWMIMIWMGLLYALIMGLTALSRWLIYKIGVDWN